MVNNLCEAELSNIGEYTIFSFAGKTITFLTSKRLEKYVKVNEWDKGYLVVMAKNKNEQPHEEYIDLLPILENLYMNPEEFLCNIKRVKIA